MEIPTKNLIVMVGLPASGKSTQAKKILDQHKNMRSVSFDEYRFLMLNFPRTGESFDVRFEPLVKLFVENVIEKYVECGYDILFDATNLTKERRLWITSKVPQSYFISYVYMDVSLEVALERNQKRERKVPENIIRDMYNSFEKFDPLNELVDDIHIMKHSN